MSAEGAAGADGVVYHVLEVGIAHTHDHCAVIGSHVRPARHTRNTTHTTPVPIESGNVEARTISRVVSRMSEIILRKYGHDTTHTTHVR